VVEGANESRISKGWLYAGGAVLVWLVALRCHLAAAEDAQLPADAVRGLERLVDIASLHSLPLRGNQVNEAWYGVADDYLLAPFVVMSATLRELLSRAALFYALVAPLGLLIGVALRRPLLGLAWGLLLAGFPDLADLSGGYPSNYQTTHWVLLGCAAALFLSQSGLSGYARARWTGVLLLAGALVTASHPLAAAGLPTALLVAAVYGRWWPVAGERRSGGGLPWWVPGALALVVFLPYAASNLAALHDVVLHDRGDQGMSIGSAWRSSLAGIKGLPTEFSDFPGGVYLAFALLLGTPLAAWRPQGRPLMLFVVAWSLGSLLMFTVAGFSVNYWNLFPLALPVLGLGLVGHILYLGAGDELRGGAIRRKLGTAVLLVLAGFGIASSARSLPDTGDKLVVAKEALADEVVSLASGRSFQYFEAQSRCGVDWGADATLLDLRLRGVQVAADAQLPLLAVVEDVPALSTLELPGLVGRKVLPNRMAVRLYWTEDASSWIDGFASWCGIKDREPNSLDVHLVPGGRAARAMPGECVVPMPCPSYLQEAG